MSREAWPDTKFRETDLIGVETFEPSRFFRLIGCDRWYRSRRIRKRKACQSHSNFNTTPLNFSQPIGALRCIEDHSALLYCTSSTARGGGGSFKNSKPIQAGALSRIARGEVVSFCVPAVFPWLFSYPAIVHVSFLLLCAVLCCFCIFFCILCFFVVTLCPCNILMTFIIFGNSSCIIFAVVRSTLLLLSFHLHSLCLRNQPVFPQFFENFILLRQ